MQKTLKFKVEVNVDHIEDHNWSVDLKDEINVFIGDLLKYMTYSDEKYVNATKDVIARDKYGDRQRYKVRGEITLHE